MTVYKDISTPDSLDSFVGAIWAPTDLIEIRTLPAERNNGQQPQSFWVTAGDLPGLADRLTKLNQSGYNIYAGICPRNAEGGATDKDTLPGWAVWSDFDHIEPRSAWTRAMDAGMPRPTLAIDSGHGCHLYWGLEDPADPEPLSKLVGNVAALVGSDSSVRNPSRIMRLPGYLNLKKPVAPCQLLHVETDRRYRFEDLRALVPDSASRQPKDQSRHKNNNLPLPSGSPDREKLFERGRQYAIKVPGSIPGGRTHAAYTLAAFLVNDLLLSEVEALPILEDWDASSNSPTIVTSYGPDELGKILKNARSYAKKAPGAALDTPTRINRKKEIRAAIPLPSEQPGPTTTLEDEFEAEGRGTLKTIFLPWSRLEDITRALRRGTVTVLAAPSGYGKSILAMQIAVHAHKQGVEFIYLILEDQKVDFERRLLAHIAGTWEIIADNREKAEWRKEILIQHKDRLTNLAKNVCENPRRPIIGSDGRPTMPPLPYQEVLDWLGRAVMSSRLVIVDPIAQIDFGEKFEWMGQADFMRHVTGLAAHSDASVILVAHTAKRGGRAGTIPLTGEDIQGAAEIKRLSHTILLLDAHDEKESSVWREGGRRDTVNHDRTIIVDKARNAGGRGNRLAFVMEGPAFREIGVIAPKEAKNSPFGNGNPSERAYKD